MKSKLFFAVLAIALTGCDAGESGMERKLRTARAQVDLVCTAVDQYTAEKRSELKSLDQLVEDTDRLLRNQDALIDPWGARLLLLKNSSHDNVTVVSSGPNRINEGGSGDDISCDQRGGDNGLE